MTQKKIILDLCGGTASWSKPYSENGYLVYNITLPKFDILDATIHEDRVIFHMNHSFDYLTFLFEDVYGILAAPPCTMFSRARQTAKTPRDLVGAMKVVRACMDIIWSTHPKFWAMENPMGILRQFMGKPVLTFNPCDYGDPYKKITDVWGYFNIPTKHPVEVPEEIKKLLEKNNRIMPKLPDDYVLPKGEKAYSARRAMTPPGFANAFFKANK